MFVVGKKKGEGGEFAWAKKVASVKLKSEHLEFSYNE
jgi:hypothetical protein